MPRRAPAKLAAGLLAAGLAAVLAAPAPPAEAATPRLRPFQDCSSLIRYGNRHVRAFAPHNRPLVTPPAVTPILPSPGAVVGDGAALPVASGGAAGGTSSTNVQEAGVDEPDTVKTDGDTVFAVGGGVLRAIDVTAPAPRVVGRLALPGGFDQQLLRRGSRLLVLSAQGGALIAGAPLVPAGRTRLSLVDVADPAHPRLLRTLDVTGSLLAARMTGDTARVVLAATARGVTDDRVDPRRANAWIPAGTFRTVRTRRTRTRALVACRALRHARAFAGLQTLTVLTIDLAKGLDPVDADGVLAGGETVYASPDNLYVATRRFDAGLVDGDEAGVPDAVTTEIHRFATGDPAATTYRGSGRVRGFLLSSWAMSERAGVLRVASTSEPPWVPGDPGSRAQSFVTTLALEDGGLRRLGRVDGLGHGERIYAVRFIGDAGYVVTFRQIDPLYTVDVSDPAVPRVRGELQLLGYSAYLHPVGDGRLLGVGQDATDRGRTLGVQVSLFDVGDLDAPALLARAPLGPDSWSAVEADHHAFLWWPETGLAVLPLSQWSPITGPGDTVGVSRTFDGAVALRVGAAGVSEAGRIAHDPVSTVTRSLVVRGRLYTLSEAGLGANALDTLAPLGFARFDP